jgi:hypothetical protein
MFSKTISKNINPDQVLLYKIRNLKTIVNDILNLKIQPINKQIKF